MHDYTSIWLPTAEKTVLSGASLGQTLYSFPLDIHLRGELGAGKTHFLQGLAKFLCIQDPLTSPTYALEQRYPTSLGTDFIHIDCYRLSSTQSHDLLQASDDHTGIRAIEWADRLKHPSPHPVIVIDLKEENEGRRLSCTFQDAPMPSREQIEAWRKEVMLPVHISEHCDAVARVCRAIAENLQEQGRLVRPLLLEHAGEIHDLFRFVDFRPEVSSGPYQNDYPEHQKQIHATWKARYPSKKHEQVCAAFLQNNGFDALGQIVSVHGLYIPSPPKITIEQKALFYADKRVRYTEVVTLEERFEDLRERYAKGAENPTSEQWFQEVRSIEKELFPDGAPQW